MGVYKLMEGKVMNMRAVWQKQGGLRRRHSKELFLYCSNKSEWCVSTRENMEEGKNNGIMFLDTAVLTPDQARPTEMCQVSDGRQFVEAAEARFVTSHD
jgi:hypothetical protein